MAQDRKISTMCVSWPENSRRHKNLRFFCPTIVLISQTNPFQANPHVGQIDVNCGNFVFCNLGYYLGRPMGSLEQSFWQIKKIFLRPPNCPRNPPTTQVRRILWHNIQHRTSATWIGPITTRDLTILVRFNLGIDPLPPQPFLIPIATPPHHHSLPIQPHHLNHPHFLVKISKCNQSLAPE